MNIDFDNPIYIIGTILGVAFFAYFYTQYRKKKRINLLQKLGFKIKLKFNRWNLSALSKLSPDIMASEKGSFGTVKLGNDPDVWWLATQKKEAYELYIFKIYKFHQEGSHQVQKEWVVITIKNNNDKQIDHHKLNKLIPTPQQYQAIDSGVSLIYRDLFFSTSKLKSLINGILDYQKQTGLV